MVRECIYLKISMIITVFIVNSLLAQRLPYEYPYEFTASDAFLIPAGITRVLYPVQSSKKQKTG